MLCKRIVALLTVAGIALWLPQALQSDDASPSEPGKKIRGFKLADPRTQKDVSLGDFADKKALAIIFVGTECPINNNYMPRLAELHREYGARGVQVLGINSNLQDTAERIVAHARKYEIPFPVLKDEGHTVADLFGAQRTPQVFVLDAARTIRYQGRIDDQFGIFYKRGQPTRHDLREALDEVLAGKPVSTPSTDVAGCIIARTRRAAVAAAPQASITYARHVAAIIQNNCQECHRPGQIGPMALLQYDDAIAWAETIREVVAERRMPPWFADPKFGKFANDRRLPEADRKLLLAWVEQGCPQGDPKYLPPPREFPEGWRIGKPDLVLQMPTEFEVPAQMPRGGIPYKHFIVDPGFEEDRWVVRGEARPDAKPVVHHMLVFILPPGQRFNPDDPSNPVLCGTAPGDVAQRLPEGMAKRIPAKHRLVFQMHYTPNGTAMKDRSSVGLTFAAQPPRLEVKTVPIFNAFFRIPPGADNHRVESTFTFERDGYVTGLMPHMHLRGKDFLYEAVYPDGTKETLLSVPRFNFHWQSVYRLEKPHKMPAGTKVHCVAHFDNSAKNPNNPDPTRTVFWGDQTWQEMMVGWMDYAYEPAK